MISDLPPQENVKAARWRKRAGAIEEWPKAQKSVKVRVQTSLRDIMNSTIHNASGLGSTRARSVYS